MDDKCLPVFLSPSSSHPGQFTQAYVLAQWNIFKLNTIFVVSVVVLMPPGAARRMKGRMVAMVKVMMTIAKFKVAISMKTRIECQH